MKLFARILTDTGKVVGKGANKFIKLEVLDNIQKVIFEKTIEAEEEKCPSCNKIPDMFGRCKCCNKDAY